MCNTRKYVYQKTTKGTIIEYYAIHENKVLDCKIVDKPCSNQLNISTENILSDYIRPLPNRFNTKNI
jgi:hypothetical protein